MAYRDYHDLTNSRYYNYNGMPAAAWPMTVGPVVDRTAAPQPDMQAPWTRGIDAPPAQGANQSGIAGQNPDASVSPSSVTGVGLGSVANNIGMGNTQGMIAGLMGLAMGLAPAPVGLIGLAPSVVDALGIQGLTNSGLAVGNQTSTNNAAVDAGQIEGLANAIGIGPNSAGPVGEDAAAASPGANAAAAAAVGANTAGMDSGPGAAASSGPGGESGSDYERGGRVYRRFQKGGKTYGVKSRNQNFPGIWDDPRMIAEDAAAYTAPESPAMKELFGYNRGELYERFKDRVGNVPGAEYIALKAKGRGADSAKAMMTPWNAQRLQDILVEGERHAPDLSRGMQVWYAMDPAHERLTQLHGDDRADQLYRRFNTFTGMASPQSTVSHEIHRGTTANALHNQGRFDDFEKWGNVPAEDRAHIAQFPPDLMSMPGNIAHGTAQTRPMRNFIDSDEVRMTSPKVPLYIGASSVPSLGHQTDMPVPDAHFSRGVGIADTRSPGVVRANASMSMPELSDVGPWFRREVSTPLGIEAVPGQARLWGLLGNRTGVESPVGAPKLELLADHIMKRAHDLGVDPAILRDAMLSGEKFKRGGRVDPFGYQSTKGLNRSTPVPRSMEHLYQQFTRPRLA